MNIMINTVQFIIPLFLLKIISLKRFSFDRETEQLEVNLMTCVLLVLIVNL